MVFCEVLKELISDRDISQVYLAEKLGITRSRLNNYISGRSEPGFDMLKDIASFFNVSVDQMLGRSSGAGFVHQNEPNPEIVKGGAKPPETESDAQWIPIYLSVSSFKDKPENVSPKPLGWLKVRKKSISSIGYRKHYALLVNDDTMAPELQPGDIAYVQPSFFLHSVIPINNLYAIRFHHSDDVGLAIKRCSIVDNILLCGSNDYKCPPIIYNMERTIFEPIVGFVIGIWRSERSQMILNSLL